MVDVLFFYQWSPHHGDNERDFHPLVCGLYDNNISLPHLDEVAIASWKIEQCIHVFLNADDLDHFYNPPSHIHIHTKPVQ